MRVFLLALMLNLAFLNWGPAAKARTAPEKELPVPSTVSHQLANTMRDISPWWNTHPDSEEAWEKFVHDIASLNSAILPDLLKNLNVSSTPGTINGVPVFTLAPAEIPDINKNRILLHLHGGGYVLNPGDAGTGEGIYMAAIGKFKVVSVDYRMPPKHPYPAALDDALAVYKGLLKDYPAENIGIFGTSTGGGMTLALAMRIRDEGLAMPGALAAGTPWTDLTKTGDSYFANENIDNILVSYDGWLKDAANLYAAGHDLTDPYLSPIYGDVKGLPPAILASGTRDLFLSNTTRMHQKMREAGNIADLLVMEGLSHAQYQLLPPDAPEALFYFGQVANFFEKYLGQK